MTMNRCLVVCLLALWAAAPAPAGAAAGHFALRTSHSALLYVSTAGRDTWSGTLPAPNAADSDGPFLTVARARDALRERRRAGTLKNVPVTVFLRGGRYALREPLRFTPEDSGTAEAPVTYRSFPGERAVLSGGRPITGEWRRSPGKPYWEVVVPEARDGQWLFHSLFVNGMSRERARRPNWNQKVFRGEGRAPGEDPRLAFTYFPGDIDPSWTDLTNVDLVLLGSWTPTLHKIREVVPERRLVRFDSTYTRTVDAYEKNFRYYVANVFEALDAPGEWYLNRRTGVLYYYPLPGEDLRKAEVIAPVLKSRIIELAGDVPAGRFVEHLRFEDLEIRHVDGDLLRYNGTYRQGHMFLDAAVYATGLRSSAFVNCELAQLGEYAIELAEGCRDNRIEHCHIWDIGAGALQIGVTDLGTLRAQVEKILPGDTVLEAEEAAVVAPLAVEADAAASKGRYVVLPAGRQGGQARFTVEVAEAGRYRILARLLAPAGESDSFLVQVNDGPSLVFDTGTHDSWVITPVVAREMDGKPLVADLRQGRNTIIIGGREAGARLDQIIVRRVREGEPADGEQAPIEVLNNVVTNNYIHRLGTLWHGCYGIVNRFASFTKITHNEITDTHWIAVGLDARWNYTGEKYSHGNEVAHNHLHHLGLGYHADAAGIYQFGPLNTHIHHNVIHDTRAYPYICGFAGIYLDEQSRNALVENNLVYNVDWYAYFQNWGMDNTIRNNIGAFARDGFLGRGGLSDSHKANYFEVTRNLYVAGDEVAIRHKWAAGEKPPALRENMYFSTTAGAKMTFAGQGLAEWQAQGYDAGSVVADPGFRNAAKREFDLKPGSAAVKRIGFQPFDQEIKKAGRFGDAAWLGLSRRYAPRPPAPEWAADDLLRLTFFSLDFENMPDGHEPTQLKLAGGPGATFAVTSEAACGGTKSLKVVDKKGLAKPFYPYAHVAPRGAPSKGVVTVSFDAMAAKSAPAHFNVECRGAGAPFTVGPSLDFSREGELTANGKEILSVEPGTWCHVEVRFEIGAGQYDLLTRANGKESRQSIPAPALRDLAWFGIVAADDADGVFYLDNLVFRVGE